MHVTLFSNYLNAHMLPLCLELAAADGVDFTFVATYEFGGNVGRANLNQDYPFVLRYYESRESELAARRHALEDEVVVFGHLAAGSHLVRERLDRGLLTFTQAERLLKRGPLWMYAPPKAWRTYDRFVRFRTDPLYALCIGGYAADDLVRAGFPLEKCLQWGYFVDAPSREVPENANRAARSAGDEIRLLWAGRMVKWKRPQDAVAATARLARQGANVHLTMLGDGPERQKVELQIARLNAGGLVTLEGAVPSDSVARHMREADVFLFTSDRHEGWGMVLGEAMSQGRAAVANVDAGSSTQLVRHGKNGLWYGGTVDGLARGIKVLVDNPALIDGMGLEARRTMESVWNGTTAARNFLRMAKALLEGRLNPVSEGPAAPAPLFKAYKVKRSLHIVSDEMTMM